MKKYAKIILNVVYIVLGVLLVCVSRFGKLDSIWSGFGGGLIGCGLVLLLKNIRYQRNAEYKERIDIEMEDERNKYLRMKAWSWAGYLYVLISAAAAVACMLMKQYEYMQLASFGCCFIMIVYVICYYILRKKY